MAKPVAERRLIRGADGTNNTSYVDLRTGNVIPDNELSNYQILGVGSDDYYGFGRNRKKSEEDEEEARKRKKKEPVEPDINKGEDRLSSAEKYKQFMLAADTDKVSTPKTQGDVMNTGDDYTYQSENSNNFGKPRDRVSVNDAGYTPVGFTSNYKPGMNEHSWTGQVIDPNNVSRAGFANDRSTWTDEDRKAIAQTLAGEIDQRYTDLSTPEGQREVQGIISTMENRAIATGKPIASLVTNPGAYSAWSKQAKQTTLANYNENQALFDNAVLGYTQNPKSNLGYTHYLNTDIANPSWAKELQNEAKIGPHTFGNLAGEYEVPNRTTDITNFPADQADRRNAWVDAVATDVLNTNVANNAYGPKNFTHEDYPNGVPKEVWSKIENLSFDDAVREITQNPPTVPGYIDPKQKDDTYSPSDVPSRVKDDTYNPADYPDVPSSVPVASNGFAPSTQASIRDLSAGIEPGRAFSPSTQASMTPMDTASLPDFQVAAPATTNEVAYTNAPVAFAAMPTAPAPVDSGTGPRNFDNARMGLSPVGFESARMGLADESFDNSRMGLAPANFDNARMGLAPAGFDNARMAQPNAVQNEISRVNGFGTMVPTDMLGPSAIAPSKAIDRTSPGIDGYFSPQGFGIDYEKGLRDAASNVEADRGPTDLTKDSSSSVGAPDSTPDGIDKGETSSTGPTGFATPTATTTESAPSSTRSADFESTGWGGV